VLRQAGTGDRWGLSSFPFPELTLISHHCRGPGPTSERSQIRHLGGPRRSLRSVEHCPRAATEAASLLLEPDSVVNTGDANRELTAEAERLARPSARAS